MAVFVDQLRAYPDSRVRHVSLYWCHLTALFYAARMFRSFLKMNLTLLRLLITAFGGVALAAAEEPTSLASPGYAQSQPLAAVSAELIGIAPRALDLTGKVSGLIATRQRGSGLVQLYDAQGQLLREFFLPADVRLDLPLALSPDGRWLAAVLLDARDGQGRVAVLPVGSSQETRALVSATVLQSGGLRGTVRLAFSPDGTRLALSNRSGYAQLWDWQTSRRLGTYPVPKGSGAYVSDLIFSPAGKWFVPRLSAKAAVPTPLVDTGSGRVMSTLGLRNPQFLTEAQLFDEGRVLDAGGTVISQPFPFISSGIRIIGFIPEKNQVLVRLPDPQQALSNVIFELRATHDGTVLRRIQLPPRSVSGASLLPGGQLVILTTEGRLQLLP